MTLHAPVSDWSMTISQRYPAVGGWLGSALFVLMEKVRGRGGDNRFRECD